MAELSLFFAAFFAATILPFSSEVALLGAIESGMPHFNALIAASFGNVLAVVFNYILGYFFADKMDAKLRKSKMGRKSLFLGHKYGWSLLFFSWLPLIGDPLTIVAGLFRVNFFYFFIIAATLRVLRYLFLTTFVI